MYNHEIKMEFINKYLKEHDVAAETKYNLQGQFNISESYESKIGKDIGDFSIAELKEMYEDLNYSSFKTIAIRITYLSQYIPWFKSTHSSCPDEIELLEFMQQPKRVIVKELKFHENKLYLEPEEVQEFIEYMPTECMKFIIICLYEGLKGKDMDEIFNLKPEDIDFDAQTVTISRGTFPVSSQFLTMAQSAIKEEGIERPVPKNTELFLESYVNDGHIVKFIKNSTIPQKAHNTFNKISTITKKNDLPANWTLNKVFESGFVLRVIQLAEDKNCDILQLRTNYKEEFYKICERYQKGKRDPAYWRDYLSQMLGLD